MGIVNLNIEPCTVFKVIEDRFDLSPHALPETFAELDIRKQSQPIFRTIIDSFCDIEAKIEALVIGSTEDHHYFASFVLNLCYF
jgi:hypothetical protein